MKSISKKYVVSRPLAYVSALVYFGSYCYLKKVDTWDDNTMVWWKAFIVYSVYDL